MDVQPSDYAGPMTLDEKPDDGRLLRSAQAADVIAEPGEERAAAMVRIRNTVRSGRVHPAGSTSPRTTRGSLLWGEDMVASLAIQGVVATVGIADREFHDRVAFRLNSWDMSEAERIDTRRYGSPAGLMLASIAQGAPFGFMLRCEWWQHVDTGRRGVEIALSQADGELFKPFQRRDKHVPVAALLVDLDPVLQRTAIRLQTIRAKMKAH